MLIDLSLCSSQVAELQNIVIPEMSGSEQAAFTHFSRNLKSRTNYKPQNPKMKDMFIIFWQKNVIQTQYLVV